MMIMVPNYTRLILLVHTSPGRPQPWGKMFLMRRLFLRRVSRSALSFLDSAITSASFQGALSATLCLEL
ncbi:hypothetical protein Taro_033717 [Colocasia esculenta]|uniref:Uncharacterized protein n=1 Tax=Colocasia esculenta TaxID=4460 RepID=A0A843W5H5_COLES|nr:hypothetical protein [Colocasia esculenta]